MRFRELVVLASFLAMPGTRGMEFPDCINGPSALTQNLVCNTGAPASERAAAIVSAMNISEKLVNLVNASPGASRIGLPAYNWWNEALHGVGFSEGVDFGIPLQLGAIPSGAPFSYATSFANPILLAAAFDDSMIQAVATAISIEARAFSNAKKAGLDYWTPNINPFKDPRWGRGAETPGEDPFRVKNYAKHFVLGLEGEDASAKRVIATCKHYAAYDLEHWNGVSRHRFDARVSTQDLVEYYLPPFQQCARDSKAGSIMCSYNSVNGIPACANTYLMDTILRGHWNWTTENQYVVSDCAAVQDIYEAHNHTKTAAQAAGVAFTAGTDNVCGNASLTDVSGAYNQSLLSEAVIDRALRRQYEGLVRVGYFDPAESNPYRSISWNDVNTPETQNLARKSAADGMVLLKNDGTLPMSINNSTSVALIGMWANATEQLVGTYFGVPPYYHGPLYAAQQLGIKTYYADGPDQQNVTSGDWTAPALEAAKQADIVIYFGGTDLSTGREELDRSSIAWSASQAALIEQVCALGKPCVVVQMGDQLDDSSLLQNSNVSAIVWVGYSGQDGGPAVFDILTGKTAPAGRLPVTQYPAEYVDQVPMTDMSLRPSTSNPGRTYKYYDGAVLPFGYGLHYTNFSVSFSGANLSSNSSNSLGEYAISDLLSLCSETHLDLCPFHPIPVSITNKGNTISDFVVLAFVGGEHGPAPYPLKELGAYARLHGVTSGETRSLELNMTLGNLARVDESGNTVLYPGQYDVLLDVPTQATATFTLVGDEEILDEWP